VLVGLGLGLVLLGAVFPRDWYDALPSDPNLALPPIKGVTLLQLAFVVEGLALAMIGWFGIRFGGGVTAARIAGPGPESGPDLSARAASLVLAGITLVALGVRLWRIDADLWLDEITPVVLYRDFTPVEIVATYLRSNNHLLNTLLVKLTTSLFGEREWAIRLPAVAFGVATVPVLYWVARSAASRAASLGAALLLALSYHHVFFSQNARGYSTYLFFSVLATGFLLRALLTNRPSAWVGFVVATVGNFASLLHSAFVFGAHALIGAVVLVLLWRRGERVGPLFGRLTVAFGAAALLGFQLYATMIPQAMVTLEQTYSGESAGFSVASAAFLRDLFQGLAEGFGAGWWLLIPFAALGLYGFWQLVRRQWLLAAAFALPLALTVVLLAARGLAASPRFFLLGLPLADIAVVLALTGAARAVLAGRFGLPAAQRVAAGVVAVLAVASAAALPAYYRTPKQDYRSTVAYALAQRRAGQFIIAIENAEHGFRFYAARAGLREGEDFVAVRTVDSLDAVVRTRGADRTILVTTFRRALSLLRPDLYARIESGWAPAQWFQGTVHDGMLVVWEAKRS
jgi:uncharacterized membrane protein